MRTYLEGLAVFGVSGLAIVFFAVCWAVTDLDALTILALDYILMSNSIRSFSNGDGGNQR